MKNDILIACVCVALLAVGCSKPPEPVSTGVAPNPAAAIPAGGTHTPPAGGASATDPGDAAQIELQHQTDVFLDELAAVPAADRSAYIRSHMDQAMSADQSLSEEQRNRFKQLSTEAQGGQ
jgi:hypothetical protein